MPQAPRPSSAARLVGRRRRIGSMLALAAGFVAMLAPPPVASRGFDADTEIAPFLEQMVSEHGFDAARLESILREARVLPDVLEAIARPAEALPWHRYRPIFVTEDRIAEGHAFWHENAESLARASEEFGVAPEIIVAIIGVETRYGRRKGRHRVLDSLSTLAFRYPKRAGFFRRELEEFLLLAREERLDPLTVRGSYAGAMGIPQFIASSYRRYAVDFDEDDVRDLMGSTADAIGSVANYLKAHGWRAGEKVALPAVVDGDNHETLLERGVRPHTTLADMTRFGVIVTDTSRMSSSGALIELDASSGAEHWVGFDNFYAITRYNHSSLYAMAVFQLAREIRARRGMIDG